MDEQNIALAYILMNVCNAISGLAALCNCIYLVGTRKKNLDTVSGRLILYLCFADSVASLFYSVILTVDEKTFLPTMACTFSVYMNIAFYHSSSLWTCMIGVHLWRAVKGKKEIEENIYHIICWGIPLIGMLIPIIAGQIGEVIGEGCFLKELWSITVFYYSPRMFFFCFVFVTIGLVLLEIGKLRKIFSWSNQNSRKHTARRRLFMIQIWVVPCTIATIILFFIPYSSWVSFVCLYINALQGLANVLSTGEKKIILAVTNLCKRIHRRIRKKPNGTELSHSYPDNTSDIQTENVPDSTAPTTASNLIFCYPMAMNLLAKVENIIKLLKVAQLKKDLLPNLHTRNL